MIRNTYSPVVVSPVPLSLSANKSGTLKIELSPFPGNNHNLIISMQSYTPNVQCSKTLVPDMEKKQCALLMNEMPATSNLQIFGPRGLSGVDVQLPYQLSGLCSLIVNTKGPVDPVSWYELWEGARAVSAICIRRGFGGISTGHGEQVERFQVTDHGHC